MNGFEYESSRLVLAQQMKALAGKYFPHISKLPELDIKESDKGPSWLNAVEPTIYVDARVAPFTEKTTMIVILHELVHYKLYLENKDPDIGEGDRFQRELETLWEAGAYKRLL